MRTEKIAVLVLDMNKDLIIHNNPWDSERLRMKIPAIKAFLRKARTLKIPIIYVTDAHRSNDWEFSVKSIKPHAIDGTDGAEIINELKPESDDYIVKKRRFSGFYGTDLDLYLRELGIAKVALVGGPTHTSIRYTAVDAYQLRYKVFVIKDCTDSPTEELYQSALIDMFFTERIKSEKFFTKNIL